VQCQLVPFSHLRILKQVYNLLSLPTSPTSRETGSFEKWLLFD
jgi:hypothetical protein